ncbi:MAG TPA: rubredoxin [Mucilaginibacter sp.]
MEEKSTLCVKINLPGGVASAGDLFEILLIAENAGAASISIGNRQQLYFEIPTDSVDDLETDMLKADISYEIDNDLFPNIISSYVADNIFNTESWLKEGVYKDIFDMFTFKPRLKINLVDQHQTFAPFFSGNFNFISSPVSNYWYFYVRFPKTSDLYCWPSLVYSDDIPLISRIAEDVILTHKHLFYDQQEIKHRSFYKLVTTGNEFLSQPIIDALKLPDFYLPYYEGINKYANGRYWLGVYRRNESFPLEFLKDICSACLKTRVGQLYTTPWKSLLIKGIKEGDRADWGDILNKYQVNVRHASNELNWQLENLCQESLELKKQLVREFEEHDLRTYRLCFAIKMQPKTGLLGSIIIKKQDARLFDILYTKDFNPNSKDFIIYKEKVHVNELGKWLIELCGFYYGLLIDNSISKSPKIAPAGEGAVAEPVSMVYQCKNCLSIYDEVYGDSVQNVPINTGFETLDNYLCPVCESPKEDFRLIEKKVCFKL